LRKRLSLTGQFRRPGLRHLDVGRLLAATLLNHPFQKLFDLVLHAGGALGPTSSPWRTPTHRRSALGWIDRLVLLSEHLRSQNDDRQQDRNQGPDHVRKVSQ
jgi:hypothetical protein